MLRREDRPEYQPQEDYVLRMVAQLREFLFRIAQQREAGRPDEALVSVMLAQERLFGKPLADFSAWSVEEQVAHLVAGRAPEEAAELCVLYSRLLEEAARIYATRGPEPMAVVARHFALCVVESAQAALPAAKTLLAARAQEIAANLAAGGGSEVVA